MSSFGVPQLEGLSDYKREDEDSEDEGKPYSSRSKRNSKTVLQLSSLKIHAPSEGFSVLREVYLTRSGATDADVDKVAWVCQGLTTLDCSGCPRIGDLSCGYLVPRMAKDESVSALSSSGGGRPRTALRGCPVLKNVYFHGTSVTDAGIRTLIASKLVASIKCIGVSDHMTSARCDEIRSRGIKATGEVGGLFSAGEAGASAGQVSLLEGVLPVAFGNALFGPSSDPEWYTDLGSLFRFATCWPDD